MSKDTKDTKDAQPTGRAWDGEADQVTPHGGDWFWGGNPPPEVEPTAKASKSEKAKT